MSVQMGLVNAEMCVSICVCVSVQMSLPLASCICHCLCLCVRACVCVYVCVCVCNVRAHTASNERLGLLMIAIDYSHQGPSYRDYRVITSIVSGSVYVCLCVCVCVRVCVCVFECIN